MQKKKVQKGRKVDNILAEKMKDKSLEWPWVASLLYSLAGQEGILKPWKGLFYNIKTVNVLGEKANPLLSVDRCRYCTPALTFF
jgi:hypothetical protein